MLVLGESVAIEVCSVWLAADGEDPAKGSAVEKAFLSQAHSDLLLRYPLKHARPSVGPAASEAMMGRVVQERAAEGDMTWIDVFRDTRSGRRLLDCVSNHSGSCSNSVPTYRLLRRNTRSLVLVRQHLQVCFLEYPRWNQSLSVQVS